MKRKDPTKEPIGGFFELELPAGQELYHRDATALSNGRACMMVALQQIQPKRAFVPHYTCDATLEPFRLLNIKIEYYQLNDQFKPKHDPELGKNDCFLLTNYWGLRQALVDRFATQLGDRLIVDNTHNYFFRPSAPAYWSFTSARKWFGVPDGAFLYSPKNHSTTAAPNSLPHNRDIDLQPALDRSLGRLDQGYYGFQKYEASMDCSIKRISNYSASILSLIDHNDAIDKRRKNFDDLATRLNDQNLLSPHRDENETPFYYPFLPAALIDRQSLHQQQIFVPQLWREVIDRAPNFSNAKTWAHRLLPLPIDHRYSTSAMDRIASTILQREPVA